MLPGRHWMNLVAVLASLGLMFWYIQSHSIVPLAIMTVISPICPPSVSGNSLSSIPYAFGISFSGM